MGGRVVRPAVLAVAVLAQAALWWRPAAAQAGPPAAITVTVTVTCSPALSAFEVDVRGTSFDPFTAVLITFDAGPGGRPESFDATTDGFGRFDAVIHPQLRPEGSYLVRADDFREGEATATATVACAPPVSPPPVLPPPARALFHPTLQFHPAITRRGFVVALRGAGFPPHGTVLLDWGDLRGRGKVTPGLEADDNGNLTVPFFLVFQETPFGADRVVASPAEPGDFDPVTAKLLVVPGTAEPPSFRVRS